MKRLKKLGTTNACDALLLACREVSRNGILNVIFTISVFCAFFVKAWTMPVHEAIFKLLWNWWETGSTTSNTFITDAFEMSMIHAVHRE